MAPFNFQMHPKIVQPASTWRWPRPELIRNAHPSIHSLGYRHTTVGNSNTFTFNFNHKTDSLASSRIRMRWTDDLHERFVRAVDELGGPKKATPRGIANLMRVEGITLFHIKSHLQKFRLGKTTRRLPRIKGSETTNSDNADTKDKSATVTVQNPIPPNPMTFNRINTLGANMYTNLNQINDLQATTMEKSMVITSSVQKTHQDIVGYAATTSLPPLSPRRGISLPHPNSQELPTLINGQENENISVEDYLQDQGYSIDFVMPISVDVASQDKIINFETLFRDAAKFAEVDDHVLDMDANVSVVGMKPVDDVYGSRMRFIL